MPTLKGLPVSTAWSQNRRAIALTALAMVLLGSNDAIMRLTGAHMATGQMMFMRGAMLCLVIFAVCLARARLADLKGMGNRYNVMRGLCELAATWLFLGSLSHVPIATATTLVFSAPVFLTAVSGPLFGEHTGPWRWAAVLAGFGGVLMITSPADAGFDSHLLAPLGAAFMVVLRDIATRYIGDDVSSVSVTLTTALAVTTGGGLSVFAGWQAPAAADFIWLFVAALLIGLSFLAYVTAIRTGELSLIAPVQYVIILVAAFYGALVWHEVPGWRETAGGLVIIASGLVILWRERRAGPAG